MILQEKGIPERRTEFLETCFDTFCKSGLENTSLQKLAESCGVTNGALLYYFGSKDNLVIEATAPLYGKGGGRLYVTGPNQFCGHRTFLAGNALSHRKAPRSKIPLYVSGICKSQSTGECGKEFFKGVNIRYHNYAELLSGKLGMPADFIQGMTYLFVRACVHFALFEDEDYLQLQLNAIRTSLRAFIAMKTGSENWKAGGAHE